MSKYRRTLVVSLLICWQFLAWTPARGGEFQQGLFWQIARDGRPVAYILGTIHSEDARLQRIVDAVSPYLLASGALALEIDMNQATVRAMQERMLLPAGKSLPELIGIDLYRQVLALWRQRGLAEDALPRLQPWAVLAELSMPPPVTGQYLDIRLYQAARAAAKPRHGLESVEQHLGVFDSLGIEDQRALLADLVAQADELPAALEQFHQAYLQEDLARLQELNDALLVAGDKALAHRLLLRLVDERNVGMVASMQALFGAQPCFVAVGALHLPGANGILALLQQRGYRVTRLPLP